ncbi:host-nuclease inhibitor Gam family protein [Zoogloea sp.]|uniref:host-nuclease inhibitor Gam family protein n=1 Tax=Zoogloea sp. TaxID=49181 RepID=UPI0031FD67A4
MPETRTIDPKVLPDVPQPKPVRSYEDADRTLLEIADCETQLQKAEAEMNEQIQKVREEYEQTTHVVRAIKASLEKEMERFCILNKADFEKTRSKELVHGTLGFRNTPPKVALLNRKYKWDTVLELLAKVRFGKEFIRTKEEINKEAVLAAYAGKEIDDQKLASVGIKVDQSEEFFLKIKWEEIPDQQKA